MATFVVAVVVAKLVLPALSVTVTLSSYVFPSLKPVKFPFEYFAVAQLPFWSL